jgi:hypothetical protein
MNVAPIIVTVYDRLEHLKRCIDALKANQLAAQSVIYIVSDAPYKNEHHDKIQQVRNYAQTINGFLNVICVFREINFGMQKSCHDAINDVLKLYDRFIILEDDVVVSTNFLQYLNEGLDYYEKDKRCFAICGFSCPAQLPKSYEYDVYFAPALNPWGFATWQNRWDNVNFGYYDRYSELKKDKKKYRDFLSVGSFMKGSLMADSRREIEATDLRICYHMFQNSMYVVYPVVSKSQNWGLDGSGVHCGNKKTNWTKPKMETQCISIKFIPFTGYDKVLLRIQRQFIDKINGGVLAKYLKYTWVHSLYKKIKTLLRKLNQ